MINVVRLKAMVSEKQRAKEAEEIATRVYNEALAYKICPSCGKSDQLKFAMSPSNGSVECTNCGMTAQWHNTRAQYTNFKEG